MGQPANEVEHIKNNLEKLQKRMKNTSSVRFFSSKRIRFDYKLSQLTIVILSLWSILISYMASTDISKIYGIDYILLTGFGIIFPVCIVVFSLIENGDSYIRSHLLEASARQLRELCDQLYTASAVMNLDAQELLDVYSDFSEKYSDCLERNQANHDDMDYFLKIYRDKLNDKLNLGEIFFNFLGLLFNFTKMQLKRIAYIFLWIMPAIFIYFIKK